MVARPSFLQRIGALVLGGGLALFATELAVRQLYFFPQEMHPVLGLVPKPGSAVHWGREGNGTSHWTVHGVRRASAPDLGSRPILVIGDSFTEALQVNDADVFTERLERLLESRHRALPVYNVGHAGGSSADYVLLGDYYRNLFHPRWTVIQLREEDLGGGAWDPSATHFVRGADQRLEVVPRPPKATAAAFAKLLPLLQRITLLNYAMVRIDGIRSTMAAPAPKEKTGWPVAETLARLVETYQGRVTFLMVPLFDPAKPSTPPSGEAEQVERSFERVCRERGLSCVNLRASYPQFAEAGSSPFGFPNTAFNTGHWNEGGHRAAAQLLAAELLRLAGEGKLD